MESLLTNLMYTLNEIFYLGCIYYSLGFSNYTGSPEDRLTAGWGYLGLLGLILMLNIAVLVVEIIKGVVNFLRARREKKKVEQLKKL